MSVSIAPPPGLRIDVMANSNLSGGDSPSHLSVDGHPFSVSNVQPTDFRSGDVTSVAEEVMSAPPTPVPPPVPVNLILQERRANRRCTIAVSLCLAVAIVIVIYAAKYR